MRCETEGHQYIHTTTFVCSVPFLSANRGTRKGDRGSIVRRTALTSARTALDQMTTPYETQNSRLSRPASALNMYLYVGVAPALNKLLALA